MIQFILKTKFEIEPQVAFNGKIAFDQVVSNIQAIQEYKNI